ncbi:MAG: hypothetical protein HY316_09125 [Acidobacteria bacterium]|nr:hypothetical protein [Acidobacteriota bacterium]
MRHHQPEKILHHIEVRLDQRVLLTIYGAYTEDQLKKIATDAAARGEYNELLERSVREVIILPVAEAPLNYHLE